MQEGFDSQTPVEFELHGYELSVPSGHVLLRFLTPGSGLFQPYRERGLALVATAIDRLHRTGVVVDIGANIGDTLAIIARHCELNVLCVEPSEYFLPFLRQNVERHFAGRATVEDCYVTARVDEPRRELMHWGGTANPIAGSRSEHGSVVPISRLVSEASNVALLKIDTDGADLDLVEGCLSLQKPTFPIYFELEITTGDPDDARAACARAQRFFSHSVDAGYRRAFAWDDPGRFYGCLDLSDDFTVSNLLNYLTHLKHRPIWGFDICLVHDSDTEFFSQVSDLLSKDLLVPLT